MSTDEVERIKQAKTEEEAARRSLCEKIKDWLVGTDSREVKRLLFILCQNNHLPEERIEVFLALKAMVAADYRENFELCCTRSDAYDPQAPVKIELVIKGIYQGDCELTWQALSFVDIPKSSNIKVKFASFLGEHPCGSRILAAGLLNPPQSPPDIIFPAPEKVGLTWKIPGSSLQEVQAHSTIHPTGFSDDFVQDCNRANYDFHNHKIQKKGCFRHGKKLGSEGQAGTDKDSAATTIENMLLQIKEIYPDDGLCKALSEVCHQGYLAPAMKYIHKNCTTEGDNAMLLPLILRQGSDCPPMYVIALKEDGMLSIEGTCGFGFCDNLSPFDLAGSRLTVKCVSTISLQSLLAGNLTDSRSEYHLHLEDNIENQFHFTARS